MEDKQFLDEAGLGEVGKVISKFYASKDDLKDLDSLKDFIDSHNEIKLHYITIEEYKKFVDSGKEDYFAYIEDPMSIVVTEPSEYKHNDGLEFGWINNTPLSSILEQGLLPNYDDNRGLQPYFLVNVKLAEKTTQQVNPSWVNASGQNPTRLQLALGCLNQHLSWRVVTSREDGTTNSNDWNFIHDARALSIANSVIGRFDSLVAEVEDKADKSKLPTKLSQLKEDETHRTVTDEEKETWNDKVGKVDGKQLSTNDYTDADKSKLDSINVDDIKLLTQRVEALESKMH